MTATVLETRTTVKVVIWGASGHGRVVADAARLSGGLSVVGFIDEDPAKKGQNFAGRPVFGGPEALHELLAEGGSVHIGVGHCETRMRLAAIVKDKGYSLQTIVHPHALVAEDVPLGEGTFVAAGVVVNSGAQIGANVILNTACSVDHDCGVERGVHVAPGARIGGLVQLGSGAFIGIGACVINCVRVGARTVVGAGAAVVTDLPANVVAYGVPAKVMRERRADE